MRPPRGRARIIIVAAAAFVAGLAAQAVFGGGEGHGPGHWWDKIPGFYMLFGLSGAALLTAAAKLLDKFVVGRDEDYYDGE